MGKISKALAKYASEKKVEIPAAIAIPPLTADDIEVLVAYDETTGHLLKCDEETGQVDERRIEELRNSGTIMRLLQNELIYAGGKLTVKGLEEARRLAIVASALPRRAATRVSGEAQGDNELNLAGDERIQAEAELRLLETLAPAMETASAPGDELPGVYDAPAKPEILQAPAVGSAPLKVVADSRLTQPSSPPVSIAIPPSPESTPSTIPAQTPTADVSADVGETRFPYWDEAAIDRTLVALLDPQSFEAEQFKILRTNILFPLAGQPPRSILLTSAASGEGKTFAAANLAISIALNINRYVLLIDADLRWPQLHSRFGFPTVPGLSNYLSEGRPLSSLLLHTKVDKLTLLPAGPPPSNPSELISSERMASLLMEVTARYPDRLIVIDAPPPTMAAETGVLARQVDGIVVVVRYGSTRREVLADLVARIGEKKILGSIVNRVETADSRYYGYRYAGYGKSNRK